MVRFIMVRALVLIVAIELLSTSVSAQTRSSLDSHVASAAAVSRRPLVDRFYEAYANMSRDAVRHIDAWLAFYDDSVFFEDPTAHMEGTGRDTVRKYFMAAFQNHNWGPIQFRIDHWAESEDWAAVEGVLSGLRSGKPISARFSTWLGFEGDRIVHQIDYVDYGAMTRQLKGEAPVAPVAAFPVRATTRMTDVAVTRRMREFYDFYERIPHDSGAGIERMFQLVADSVRMEDPTAGFRITGRNDYRATFEREFLAHRWGPARWAIMHHVTTGDWVAVEGVFTGLVDERAFATRFTTWLQIRDGRIAHLIDYVDYPTMMRRQVSRP
jgi:ketosteroid isomerase-like protein